CPIDSVKCNGERGRLSCDGSSYSIKLQDCPSGYQCVSASAGSPSCKILSSTNTCIKDSECSWLLGQVCDLSSKTCIKKPANCPDGKIQNNENCMCEGILVHAGYCFGNKLISAPVYDNPNAGDSPCKKLGFYCSGNLQCMDAEIIKDCSPMICDQGVGGMLCGDKNPNYNDLNGCLNFCSQKWDDSILNKISFKTIGNGCEDACYEKLGTTWDKIIHWIKSNWIIVLILILFVPLAHVTIKKYLKI
ncbi:hypothetical protein HY498_03215, partial [Candidatus Woesearchaeota archaeon]|nr:hypothetical protein [Candidatus Woesearchaeota archaeon]